MSRASSINEEEEDEGELTNLLQRQRINGSAADTDFNKNKG
jgi:hypothetical protein